MVALHIDRSHFPAVPAKGWKAFAKKLRIHFIVYRLLGDEQEGFSKERTNT